MSKILCSPSFAFDSAHVKYGVWTGPKDILNLIAFDEVERLSLILLRDYAELVALCKVIVWKTHIPVRTQKWPPLLIFAGARRGIVIRDLKIRGREG